MNRRNFVRSGLLLGPAAFYNLQGLGGAAPTMAINVRRDIGDLAIDDPILKTYIRGVDILKSLPASDLRRWDNIAKIHASFCPHGNWFFLPWHRAYLLMFENIIRSVTNTPEFALPYWNWTKDTQIPAPFWKDSLIDTTRRVTENDTLPGESIGQQKMDDIMRERRFELFGSTKPYLQNSTDVKFQRSAGGMSLLEGTPHNDVHVWVSGNMVTMLSPLDPIFWLHHCNIDRIWAEWNSKNNVNTSDKLWRDFTFKQNFASAKDTKYDVVVSSLEDTLALGYRYPGVNPAPDQPLAFVSTPFLETKFSEKFSAMRVESSKVGQQAVFPVDLSETAASQAKSIRTDSVASGQQPRVIAIIKNVNPGDATNIRVRVFLDCDYLSESTPPNDPHYIGSFSFFGANHTGHGAGHHNGAGEDVYFSYIFDLTKTLERLNRLNRSIDSELNIQLLPVSFDGKRVENVNVKFEGVEIVLA